MKFNLSILTFLVAAVGFQTAAGGEKTCKQVTADIMKRQLAEMGPCAKSIPAKNGKEKAAKGSCVIKCVMMKLDFLGKDGMFTEDVINNFADREYKEATVNGQAKEILNKCRAAAGATLDPKDEFCKSYDPLVKCLMENAKEFCAA